MPVCWRSANSALARISDKNWHSITLFFVRIEMVHATLLISGQMLSSWHPARAPTPAGRLGRSAQGRPRNGCGMARSGPGSGQGCAAKFLSDGGGWGDGAHGFGSGIEPALIASEVIAPASRPMASAQLDGALSSDGLASARSTASRRRYSAHSSPRGHSA